MDLRAKAEEYRRRGNRLREIAKGFQAAGAHYALLQAADTWDQLARAALRDLDWQAQAAMGVRDAVDPENSDKPSIAGGEVSVADLQCG